MNPHLTEIAYILDCSGSMRPMQEAAVSAFNDFLTGYRQELGENAYAVFNTLTDIADRPPKIACFQQTRDTIERRSGRWLKDLARQSQTDGFDLNAWIPAWPR